MLVSPISISTLWRHRRLDAALRAQPACEPLRQHADRSRGRQERLDAHLGQARDRAGGVVGVQRAQHEVAGQRGFDGDLGGLVVANLTDHHDVGVAPQDRAQAGGERQARLDVDLHLVDALQAVLDRVLDGDDVLARLVELVERAVEARRLTRTGRAGDDDGAVRPLVTPSRSAARTSGSKPRSTARA